VVVMMVMARMRSSARESGPAQWAEAAAVSCEARLGAGDIRHGGAAKPERVAGAGLAGRLGNRRG